LNFSKSGNLLKADISDKFDLSLGLHRPCTCV